MNCVYLPHKFAWLWLQSQRKVKARGEVFCTTRVQREYHGLIIGCKGTNFSAIHKISTYLFPISIWNLTFSRWTSSNQNFIPPLWKSNFSASGTEKKQSLSRGITEEKQRMSIGINLKSQKHKRIFGFYWNNLYLCTAYKPYRCPLESLNRAFINFFILLLWLWKKTNLAHSGF